MRYIQLVIVLLSFYLFVNNANANSLAETATLTIDTSKQLHPVSQDLWGIFFEEINHAGVGGLYSQQIQNSNFETLLTDYAPWFSVPNSKASYFVGLSQDNPLHWESPTSLQVSASSNGQTTVGVANPGFWGISLAGQQSFDVSFYAYSSTGVSSLTASLVSSDLSVSYGSSTITGISSKWQNFSTTISISNTADTNATFVLSWSTSGNGEDTLYFDVVTLFPSKRWHGLNFINSALGDFVYNLRPSFVRFPGGCYVEGDRLFDRFNWKKAIGGLETRRGHWNLWNYYSEDGLGLLEYLSFIEQLVDIYGNPTRAIWVINNGISHTESIATSNLASWVQDALDSIEYARGNTSTRWGALRAAHGHPAPFTNLRYVAIGNEDCGKPYYTTNYQAFFQALQTNYPDILLIANCNMEPTETQVWDYHVYTSSGSFYSDQFEFDDTKKYPRNGPKVFNSEYAVTSGCGQGNMNAALGEAAWMTGLERNSDVVVAASYAPLFVNANDRKWNPDAIVFKSGAVYGTPSYWLQQLFSNSYNGASAGSVYTLSNTLQSQANISVSVTKSKISQGSYDAMYVLKAVNYGGVPQTLNVALENFSGKLGSNYDINVLQVPNGDINAENSFENPNNIVPKSSQATVSGSNFSLNLAQNSVYVFRFYSAE